MATTDSPNLECRMYESMYPEVDTMVMIQVKNIAVMGAYVPLLEYNNIEGMILFSELSNRRLRSVSSHIRVSLTEPVMVLRVDMDRGYIDLSKRRVCEDDVQACEESALSREVKDVGPEGQEVAKVVPAVTEEIKEVLIKNIKRRMTLQPMKIRADIEMKCFQFDGVLHIKVAIGKAEAARNERLPCQDKIGCSSTLFSYYADPGQGQP